MLNFIDEMHLTPEQVEFLKENKKSAFYAKLCGMSTRVKVFQGMFNVKNPIYQEQFLQKRKKEVVKVIDTKIKKRVKEIVVDETRAGNRKSKMSNKREPVQLPSDDLDEQKIKVSGCNKKLE